MPKPTPEEVLRGIEESEVDDEVEKVLAMTPEEREKELVAAGYDMAKVTADADAMYERMQRAAIESKAKDLETQGRTRSLRPPRRRQPVIMWIAAAVGVAVVGGVVYAMVTKPPEGPPPSAPAPSTAPSVEAPVDLVAAQVLRKKAFAACEAKAWEQCLARFDDAKKVDPAGDRAPEVVIARQQARRGMTEPAPPSSK